MVKLVSGAFMFIFGLFFCFTGVGAIIGLPMVGGGLWLGFTGMASMGLTAVKTGVAAGKVVRDYQNRDAVAPAQVSQSPVAFSAADEITKLVGLRDAGHITQAQFEERRAKILAQA